MIDAPSYFKLCPHTPYSVALSTLIVLQLDVDSPFQKEPRLWELIQNEIEEDPTESTAKELIRKINSQDYLKYLNKGLQTLDHFMDLLSNFQTMHVDPESLVGLYLRKFCSSMNFETTAALWEDTRRDVQHRERQETTATTVSQHSQTWTKPQIQRQVATIQNEPNAPIIIDDQPQHLSSSAFSFLNFIQYSKTNEKEKAIHALHSYLHAVPLQYSTILLAAYFYEQGDVVLSQLATEEAIQVAQQSQDPQCVQFCLGWMYQHHHFRDRGGKQFTDGTVPPPPRSASLIEGLALLKEIQSWAENGITGIKEKSVALSTPAEEEDDDDDEFEEFPLAGLSSRPQLDQILAKRKLVHATLQDDNMTTMLDTWTALHCYKMLPEHIETAVINLSRSCLAGTLAFDIASVNLGGSALNRALESRAVSERSCVYAEALWQLLTLRRALGMPLTGSYSHEVALILTEWAIRRGEVSQAQSLLDGLCSSLHPSLVHYERLVFDSKIQKALLFWLKNDSLKAKDILVGMIDECKSKDQRVQQAQLLLYLATMQLDTSKIEFFHALPSLMECLILCEDLGLLTVHASAATMVAEIHWRRGKADRGIAVLKACIPELRKNGHVWFQAEAHFVLAKCYLHLESPSLRPSLKALKEAESLFLQCQDRRRLRTVYDFQARLYHHLHELDSRDEAASRFVKLSRHSWSSSSGGDDVMNAGSTCSSPLGYSMDEESLMKLCERKLAI